MKACDVLGPPEDVKDGNVKKMINHLILLLHNHPERERRKAVYPPYVAHTRNVSKCSLRVEPKKHFDGLINYISARFFRDGSNGQK